ncbi:MAG: hypothetical protein AAF394_12070, partial [Planctomycetota bacterium]
ELAKAAFQQKYPEATEQMLSAAVYHLFADGVDACVEWLAELERFLRDDDHTLSHGFSWHLLHHVYNWHQLESLMPHGKSAMYDLLDEILESASENDMDGVCQSAKEFKAILDGDDSAPSVEDNPAEG